MNIRFLETVLWLARLRSIKATADKLRITHAAISNRIAAIEQDLGVRLFVRSEQGFEPTADGNRFIVEAQKVIDAYQQLRRTLLDPARLRGHARIGAVSTLIPTIFPGLMRTVREEYPHVSLGVTTELSDRLLKELEADRLDLVLTSSGEMSRERFEVVPLCVFAMRFVASPLLGIDCSTPLSIDQLAAHTIIGYPPNTDSQARVERYFASANQRAVLVHASNALPTNVQMVASGIGVAAVPLAAVRRELDEGALVEVPTREHYVDVSYFAAFKRDGQQDLPRAIAALARQAATRFCESSNPAHAWQDEVKDQSQESR